MPCTSWVLEKLCGAQTLVLEKHHAQQGPAVPMIQNQEAKLSRCHISGAPYRQTSETTATRKQNLKELDHFHRSGELGAERQEIHNQYTVLTKEQSHTIILINVENISDTM